MHCPVELDYNRVITTVEQKMGEKEEADATMPKGKTATIDLGICNLGAMTDGQEALILNGRGLRSLAQQLAKGLAEIATMQACCKKEACYWEKLQRAQYRMALLCLTFPPTRFVRYAWSTASHFCRK